MPMKKIISHINLNLFIYSLPHLKFQWKKYFFFYKGVSFSNPQVIIESMCKFNYGNCYYS